MQQSMEMSDASPGRVSQITSLAALKLASRWLSNFAENITSQDGEDGLIAKALSLLPDRSFWCVEFGAWDGKHLSNTYNLIGNMGYNVVLIEGDSAKYKELCDNYPHKDRAIFVNAFVGWSEKDSLDQILRRHPVPQAFDLLSVDVDGNDYHIWKALELFQPKLVLIEYNISMVNAVQFVQPAEAGCHQGSSPASLIKLGSEKGYELIAVTKHNLLFVRREYYPLFSIPDNSLEVMRDEEPNYVFFGYDGTVFLEGNCCPQWHPGWRLSAQEIQVLPRIVRTYPPNYTFVQAQLLRLLFMLKYPSEGLNRIINYFKINIKRQYTIWVRCSRRGNKG
jgi:hypothetical protein